MTAAVDMYKDHLRHTARLQEIKHKKFKSGHVNDFTTSRLSARSNNSSRSSTSSLHDLCRPRVFKRKELTKQILKRNEQIFVRLQEIHGVSISTIKVNLFTEKDKTNEFKSFIKKHAIKLIWRQLFFSLPLAGTISCYQQVKLQNWQSDN